MVDQIRVLQLALQRLCTVKKGGDNTRIRFVERINRSESPFAPKSLIILIISWNY